MTAPQRVGGGGGTAGAGGGPRPPVNPWTALIVIGLVLLLAGGAGLLLRLRYLLLAAALGILAHGVWKGRRRAAAPYQLREQARQYAAGRLTPGEWPPPFPPPLNDVAELIRQAGLAGAGPEYVGQALNAIRRTWSAHFAVRWAREHPGLLGRDEYLAAYRDTFGRDLGYADYLHLVLEERYGRGLRPEVTRAELAAFVGTGADPDP